jgi:hypothetical protein
VYIANGRGFGDRPWEFFFGDNAMFQKQNVPMSVKMVSSVCLVFAIVDCSYACFFSTAVLAPFAFVEGLLFIAVAVGLLNLKEGWRVFMLILTGIGLLLAPVYFLAIVSSSNIAHSVSNLSGVDSRGVGGLAIVLSFAMCLWMFITLRRSDVKRTFESGRINSQNV